MLAELRVSELLDKTASSDPVPGGGSIAALSAAAAAGLAEMVANLTVGKKGYEAVEEEMKAVAAKMRPLREKFLKDMDRDADAYNEVFSSFKMPKRTEEEKEKRQKAIQEGLKHAASVPLGVAEDAFSILGLVRTVIAKGNKNAVTDGAVSAMMARTAVLSALYNVKINLGSIKDEAFVNRVRKKVKHLDAETVKMEKEILSLVDI
ncbi:MAG TPA: cyclodeaminase/cyclohydrolase family protein [Deltaproteobacteria bacterium]|nr:cyclodeaminase/cyclohydrolase family protein [Deltaproteobacteria bacterium]